MTPPIVLHGDPEDPFASPKDIVRILRLMGERDEQRLSAFRSFLETPSAEELSGMTPPIVPHGDLEERTSRRLSTSEVFWKMQAQRP